MTDMTDRKLYLGPLTDNRRWDMVDIRPDNVFVVTPPKCGTTWMQTIVALLLSGDPEVDTELSVKMPWIDIRIREMPEVAERLDAMKHEKPYADGRAAVGRSGTVPLRVSPSA
jgi:aryl sulfotransferase